jgi:hypothetical protein
MEKIISLPILLVGLYALSAVFIKRNRQNWRGTGIKTGALTNLGFGLFFTHGAAVILLVELPFESFISALFIAVIPMCSFFYIIAKGYSRDVAKHNAV